MEKQYFVRLNENNEVIDLAVVTKEYLEANPQRYEGRWVETFFQHPTKTYADIGCVYDEEKQDFYYPYAVTDPDPEKRFS